MSQNGPYLQVKKKDNVACIESSTLNETNAKYTDPSNGWPQMGDITFSVKEPASLSHAVWFESGHHQVVWLKSCSTTHLSVRARISTQFCFGGC